MGDDISSRILIRKSIFLGLILLGVVYLSSFRPFTPPMKIYGLIPKKESPEKVAISLRVLPKIEEKQEVKNSEEKQPTRARKDLPQSFHFNPNKALVNKGRELLGEKGQKIGSFPSIRVNYRKYLGIKGYISAMHRLGGKFFIMNMGTGKLAASIDFDTRQIKPAKDIAGLSPRSRAIEDEPELSWCTKLTEKDYGKGAYVVILLLPLKIDYYIIGAVSAATRELGHDIKAFSSFFGVYVSRNHDLYLGIYRGKLKNGRWVKLNMSMKLTS